MATEKTKIELEPIQLGADTVEVDVTQRKTKGSGDEYILVVPKIPLDRVIPLLSKLLGGEDVLAAAILRELVKPAGYAATPAGYLTNENGEPYFDNRKYQEAFINEFQAPSRQSGVKKAELQERMQQLVPLMSSLMMKSQRLTKEGKKLDNSEEMELANYLVELTKLSEQLESKTRGAAKGKHKKGKAIDQTQVPELTTIAPA